MKKLYSKIRLIPTSLFFILALGVFLRTTRAEELFLYSHDQDLAGWFVKDIVMNHHFRLIGQETTVHGVFIGPAWYYFLVPFYVLQGMAPTSGLITSIIVGFFTILSIWFVLKEIFTSRTGFIAALIYASSFLLVMTDREVVPTTAVVLWSVWFMFSLHLILIKKQWAGFFLTSFLFALAWNINLALVLLLPVSFIALLFSKTWPNIRAIALGVFVGVVTLSPFLLFEIKNSFMQTKTIFASVGGDGMPLDFMAKLDRTTTLLSKNIAGVYLGDYINLPDKFALFSIVLLFVFLVIFKKLSRSWVILGVFWVVLYILFFSHNPLNLSEYYLNGLTILWVAIPALLFDILLSNQNHKKVVFVILSLFVSISVIRFFSQSVNASGYVQKSALVAEIKSDADIHGYPCVAVSYITSPGNDLGYRYLFYYQKLRVNLPKSQAPVYTIVFPHSLVDRIDKSFGALGLIYPDYKKYTNEGIQESCRGEDQNLNVPLFGFTQ